MKKTHAIKKRGFMSQPATGHYVDCRCGRTGGLKNARDEASADHYTHVAEALNTLASPKSSRPDVTQDRSKFDAHGNPR